MTSRGSTSLRAGLACSFAGLAALLACDSPSLGPDDHQTTLSFAISTEAGFATTADAGLIRLEGPSSQQVPILPGETKTIPGLLPGTYAVALEALLQGLVEAFGETSVTVVAGQNRQANVVLRSFIPGSITVAAQTPADQPINVQWTAVQGATSYLLEISNNPAFTNASSAEVPGTSANVGNPVGTYYFRVRAKNRFGSIGLATPSHSPAVIPVETPPSVANYQITIQQVGTCPAGFRDMATVEQVGYQDSDGNFPTTQPLIESSTPALVESEFRFATNPDWRDFSAGKTWTRLQGATGSAGQISSSSCWRVTDNSAYVDHRIRLQDTRGNWGDWTTTRLMLPVTMELTPDTAVVLAAGAAHQYVAIVRDANGSVIPGAVNWSNYSSPEVGVIGQDGRYLASATSNGLDFVYAWAGFTQRIVALRGPLSVGLWWAPCWGQPGLSSATSGTFQYYRMRVYAGAEYRFTLEPTVSTASGDPDLYIRLDAQPTTSSFDARSDNPAQSESITWTAPAHGVVWIGVHAFTAFSDVGFGVGTTDNKCGFPGADALRASPPVSASGASHSVPMHAR